MLFFSLEALRHSRRFLVGIFWFNAFVEFFRKPLDLSSYSREWIIIRQCLRKQFWLLLQVPGFVFHGDIEMVVGVKSTQQAVRLLCVTMT
jgi:hypothetical protein